MKVYSVIYKENDQLEDIFRSRKKALNYASSERDKMVIDGALSPNVEWERIFRVTEHELL